jgi:hypothetical protein
MDYDAGDLRASLRRVCRNTTSLHTLPAWRLQHPSKRKPNISPYETGENSNPFMTKDPKDPKDPRSRSSFITTSPA